ncbi:hypothetical protein C9J27_05545 [Photobacterium kishitanii]|uniref:Uncharacterized protein n=1 Tax=Photobacterium kishitanii TaxID=318456 RepID=A0A2T3KLR3_9GAMM|nr:hypothetical protein C9J27_05545 [Photobacterium kishitanii]
MKCARLSVEALAKSLNLDTNNVRELVAKTYDCKSWMFFVEKCTKGAVGNDEYQQSQKEMFLSKFFEHANINIKGNAFAELARLATPYSLKPRVFRVDVSKCEDGAAFDFNDVDFNTLDENFGEMLRSVVDTMGVNLTAEQEAEFRAMIDSMSPSDLKDSFRLGAPCFPYPYALFLNEILGWKSTDLNGCLFAAERLDNILEQQKDMSLFLVDGIPAFVFPVSICPGDGGDSDFLNNNILCQFKDFKEDHLLFLGSGLSKKINGKEYSVIGMRYSASTGKYYWVFLCKMSPDRQLSKYGDMLEVDDLENTLESTPLPNDLAVTLFDYGKNKVRMNLVYHCAVNPDEDSLKHLSIHIRSCDSISGASGWSTFVDKNVGGALGALSGI